MRGAVINGNNATIDGGGEYRGLFLGVGTGEAAVSPGLTAMMNTGWAISDLTIRNTNAHGGNGGETGGGGTGFGGAHSSTPGRSR